MSRATDAAHQQRRHERLDARDQAQRQEDDLPAAPPPSSPDYCATNIRGGHRHVWRGDRCRSCLRRREP